MVRNFIRRIQLMWFYYVTLPNDLSALLVIADELGGLTELYQHNEPLRSKYRRYLEILWIKYGRLNIQTTIKHTKENI